MSFSGSTASSVHLTADRKATLTVALFGKAPPLTELIDKARRVFQEFTPDDDYWADVLTPLLGELYAALKLRRFKTVDDFEALAAPLRTMPPVTAVLCAASVLHAGRKLFTEAPLGDVLAMQIAIAGMSQAWKAVPLVDDKTTARRMIKSMDVLWRHEPTPFREMDHAQVVYVSGHLALPAGEGRDVLKERWREALRLLAEVNPEAANTQEQRERVARTKESNSKAWSSQLAELPF
jgi:hypothetical protein